MKINFEIDDHDLIYQLMDGMFVVMLKNALREEKANHRPGEWADDDDLYEKNVAAYEHLIKYYSNPNEVEE